MSKHSPQHSLPPPAFCVEVRCVAWEQRREDKMQGSGCGALVTGHKGCILTEDQRAAMVAEERKK